MTALQALKSELRRVQVAQVKCVDKYNIVIPFRRYEYNLLIREGSEIRNNIEFMENLQAGKPGIGARK
ncbi:hypothetical protein LCGC14_2172080 [marine sediment metagenome]|uniref:Uncharacterized protein n=1 Tax=marine sediment metagenome TaxID=412755 RepID=A0A0F9DPU1_9ZZZZ